MIHPLALEACVRSVASQTGDCRRVLDLCKRTLKRAASEQEKKSKHSSTHHTIAAESAGAGGPSPGSPGRPAAILQSPGSQKRSRSSSGVSTMGYLSPFGAKKRRLEGEGLEPRSPATTPRGGTRGGGATTNATNAAVAPAKPSAPAVGLQDMLQVLQKAGGCGEVASSVRSQTTPQMQVLLCALANRKGEEMREGELKTQYCRLVKKARFPWKMPSSAELRSLLTQLQETALVQLRTQRRSGLAGKTGKTGSSLRRPGGKAPAGSGGEYVVELNISAKALPGILRQLNPALDDCLAEQD